MKVFKFGVVALVLLSSLAVLGGCGAGEPDKPVSIASEAQVNNYVKMREIFDKAGGKRDSLSAEDWAEYVRLAGGEESKATTLWESMSNPTGSGASSGR